MMTLLQRLDIDCPGSQAVLRLSWALLLFLQGLLPKVLLYAFQETQGPVCQQRSNDLLQGR